MKNNTKVLAFMGLCTSLALIMAYVEVLIPPLVPSLPGIKMGLPNIVIVFLLYRCNFKTAGIVSIIRIVLITVLFGNALMFSYSLAGGVLSLVLMTLLRKLNVLSVVGVSISGAVVHNLGQILMAMLLLETAQLGYYLLILTVSGTIAGVLVGLCAFVLIKKIPRSLTNLW